MEVDLRVAYLHPFCWIKSLNMIKFTLRIPFYDEIEDVFIQVNECLAFHESSFNLKYFMYDLY